MTEQPNKWAPWWVYVVIIAVANFAKQRLLEDAPIAANLGVTAVLVGGLIAAITAVYRISADRPR